MAIKVEEGKYYRTRDGRKVGPMAFSDGSKDFAGAPGFGEGNWYTQHSRHFKGEYINVSIFGEQDDDLVAEWVDSTSPVRTVTHREVVPGIYGNVHIHVGANYPHIVSALGMHKPEELRAAAATLVEIAEALEDA